DVHDALLAAVRGSLLPLGCELEDGVEHVAHAYDRRLASPPLAEGGVDERPARRDPHPERAVVTEHDLLLGRLTENAHVRDSAVRRQEPRAGGIAPGLPADAS